VLETPVLVRQFDQSALSKIANEAPDLLERIKRLLAAQMVVTGWPKWRYIQNARNPLFEKYSAFDDGCIAMEVATERRISFCCQFKTSAEYLFSPY
jgi:hypothetical protein